MVKIILNNKKKDSPYKSAILNLSEGNCIINNEEVALDALEQFNFSHPLLTELPLHSSTNLYRYSYHNFADLLLVPRLVYSTLLHAKNPLICHFEILPSSSFFKLKSIYKIPFSLYYPKSSKQQITIIQLNNII
ncbi:hypothetical protein, partial [Neisseria dumasiana]|uniref:hypothetical protein n=1 Tax=Neisseria dumasiana TaxID=1931275 RepID=UPI000A22EC86